MAVQVKAGGMADLKSALNWRIRLSGFPVLSAVIGRFSDDSYVVWMAFSDAGGGDADETGLLEVFDVFCSAVTHGCS